MMQIRAMPSVRVMSVSFGQAAAVVKLLVAFSSLFDAARERDRPKAVKGGRGARLFGRAGGH